MSMMCHSIKLFRMATTRRWFLSSGGFSGRRLRPMSFYSLRCSQAVFVCQRRAFLQGSIISVSYTHLFIIEHLNILKKANELCDYLIVGVSKDEVVQGYKNKLREAYLKRRLTWVSDAMKFLKIKKSKTVDFQKLECEELIDLI